MIVESTLLMVNVTCYPISNEEVSKAKFNLYLVIVGVTEFDYAIIYDCCNKLAAKV